MRRTVTNTIFLILCVGMLAACGGRGGGGGLFGGQTSKDSALSLPDSHPDKISDDGGRTIWDLFRRENTETNVQVNRYIWNASLQVLDFLPIQSIDPFTGVIVTGYGTPPGGGRSYRATVLIDDPALDARSLKLSLQTRGGRPASTATIRAVEDAILTRARQLRIGDSKL